MEPKNEVDKNPVAVVYDIIIDKIIGYLPKAKSGICCVKNTGEVVNFGDKKGIPCLLQFTGNCKMTKILLDLIYKLLLMFFFQVNKMAISVNFLKTLNN